MSKNTAVKIVSVTPAPSQTRDQITKQFGAKAVKVIAQNKVLELTLNEKSLENLTAEDALKHGTFIARKYNVKVPKLAADENDEARGWAQIHGIKVGERGRLSAEVINLFKNKDKMIREWAKEQGIEIGSRGRIPAHVEADYTDAMISR